MNAKKTEYMICGGDLNIIDTTIPLKSNDGTVLNQVKDFKYLGAWIASSSREVIVRIAQAWSSATRLKKIWISQLSQALKKQFFQSTVQAILLYGCETWSLTKTLSNRLNGAYTKLLRYITDCHWSQRIRNEVLYNYNGIPSITNVIRHRRIRFSGHCVRATNQPLHQLVLRQPSKGFRRGGGAVKTYPKQILEDLSPNFHDTPTYDQIQDFMLDKKLYNNYFKKNPPKTMQTSDRDKKLLIS